jgi:hypothetical protein
MQPAEDIYVRRCSLEAGVHAIKRRKTSTYNLDEFEEPYSIPYYR